ncbi:MAG: hypothetical protein MZU79_05855 [Anaerotruncus sp.]|nr:hypothetical protein [Anaerotruncus sp.]
MTETNLLHRGIPITLYTPKDGPGTHVFFLVHGHTGNRFDPTIVRFARMLCDRGMTAVSVDAFRHGERKTEPYVSLDGAAIAKAMVEVLEQTCKDIKTLYDDLFRKDGLSVGVLGTSMGGHVSYLLPGVLPETTIAIPLIGAPDVKRHYRTSKKWLGDGIEPLFVDRSIPLHADPAWFEERHLLQINGTKDDVVRYENAFDFHLELKTASPIEHWFVLEGCGHEITESMHKTVGEFLDAVLAKKGKDVDTDGTDRGSLPLHRLQDQAVHGRLPGAQRHPRRAQTDQATELG